MDRRLFLALAASLALAACSGGDKAQTKAPAAGAQIDGAGATFPAPLYAKWAEAQRAETGLTLNYQAIGSGGGIKQIGASTVDFGATDKPLKPDDLAAGGLAMFPTVIGGVVPVMNLPGVKPGQIKLTGPQLADRLQAAHPGHVQVHQHGVELLDRQPLERLHAAGRHAGLVPKGEQGLVQHMLIGGLVVDDEDAEAHSARRLQTGPQLSQIGLAIT